MMGLIVPVMPYQQLLLFTAAVWCAVQPVPNGCISKVQTVLSYQTDASQIRFLSSKWPRLILTGAGSGPCWENLKLCQNPYLAGEGCPLCIFLLMPFHDRSGCLWHLESQCHLFFYKQAVLSTAFPPATTCHLVRLFFLRAKADTAFIAS